MFDFKNSRFKSQDTPVTITGLVLLAFVRSLGMKAIAKKHTTVVIVKR